MITVTKTKLEVARHGKKYGNSLQNFERNTFGKLSAGRDSVPPRSGLGTSQSTE